MSLEVFPAPTASKAQSLALRPIAFDGLFGWFSPGITSRGVILCGTLGYEQLSAHRAWRGLGERIATTGCSVLRFDYPGEGDSGDEGAREPDRLVSSIHRAIHFLRDEAGAEEIVLVGLRFGGTLATLAAETAEVDRLVVLAPFASGRAYFRELKLQSRSIGCLPDGAPLPEEPGILGVGGFRYDATEQAAFSALSIASPSKAPARRVLMLGTDASGLAAKWRALGAEVETGPFAGLPHLVTNPLFAQTPEEAFAAAVAFAADGAVPRPDPARRERHDAQIGGPGWSEEPIAFGVDLFGMLCRPAARASRSATVLFLNAGSNVHSGWGRNTTRLARRLAERGFASLRIDLGGLGDSPDRSGGKSPVYDLDSLADVRAALDAIEARVDGPVVAVGGCSGAYLAFHALCREPRLKGALAINLYCFDWNPADDLETVVRGMFRPATAYAGMLRQGDAWKRLLRGEVRVGAIAARLAKSAAERMTRPIARLLRPKAPGGSVIRRIADLRKRGASLRLVYSAGDHGLEALREELGRTPRQVARRLGEPAFVIENADHDLSTAIAQAQLEAIVSSYLRTFDNVPPSTV